MSQPEVVVRRSKRRTRTVSAFREDGRVVVAIPARFTAAQEEHWVAKMLERLDRTERRRRPSDEALMRRSMELSRLYLGGAAVPSSVAWVTNQNKRWGSCTISTREIRISHQIQGVPEWVLDSVLVHELAHLLEPTHNARFRQLESSYPRLAEAKAFLLGLTWAREQGDLGEQSEVDWD